MHHFQQQSQQCTLSINNNQYQKWFKKLSRNLFENLTLYFQTNLSYIIFSKLIANGHVTVDLFSRPMSWRHTKWILISQLWNLQLLHVMENSHCLESYCVPTSSTFFEAFFALTKTTKSAAFRLCIFCLALYDQWLN